MLLDKRILYKERTCKISNKIGIYSLALATMASRRKTGRTVKSTVGKGRLSSSMNETRTMGPIAMAKQRERATLRSNQASEGKLNGFNTSRPLMKIKVSAASFRMHFVTLQLPPSREPFQMACPWTSIT